MEHYNNIRLKSAIGYITPKDMLAGHQQEIQAERDRKLDAAKEQWKNRGQGAVGWMKRIAPVSRSAELTQRQGQACSQRSESPRFCEGSLHLGMRAR